MKLKYMLETVDMGDELIAVPVGEGADQISGVIRLNSEGLEIINLFKEEQTIETAIEILSLKYDNKDDMRQYVRRVVDVLRDANLIDE